MHPTGLTEMAAIWRGTTSVNALGGCLLRRWSNASAPRYKNDYATLQAKVYPCGATVQMEAHVREAIRKMIGEIK